MARAGICSICGLFSTHLSRGLCNSCYYLPQGKSGLTCQRCGKERPLNSKGLCNSCNVAEYKQKTGYKGPVRECVGCHEVKPIHAHGRCQPCHDKWYNANHKEEIRARDKQRREKNPEKYKAWGANWRANNVEHRAEYQRKYGQQNKARLNANRNRNYWKNPEKYRTRARLNARRKGQVFRITLTPEERMQMMIRTLPPLKCPWVKEFLAKPYSNRSIKTKLLFLKNLLRLLKFIRGCDNEKVDGGWNMLSLADVDRCQVETGILKDSVRVFFQWLKSRKALQINLADAIPTQTSSLRITNVSDGLLRSLMQRWNSGQGNLAERIAGLLIIYYGLTNEELRYLKVSDFLEGEISIGDERIEVEPILADYITEYLLWREEFYFGLAPEYFFITGISVARQQPVSLSYFSKLFKANGIHLSPSELRKAMIMFLKRKNPTLDPVSLGSLFRISARGAARYFV